MTERAQRFPDGLFCGLARYNRWMNRALYDCGEKLTDAQRKENVGAFFKSLHGTLNHLLVGDGVWMGRFVGPVFVPTSLAQELHSDFAGLRRAREAMDARIVDWAGTLTAEALAGQLRYVSITNPAPRVIWRRRTTRASDANRSAAPSGRSSRAAKRQEWSCGVDTLSRSGANRHAST